MIMKLQSGRENLTGKRYGKLTVLISTVTKNKKRVWVCLCDCGKRRTVTTEGLVKGTVRSCTSCEMSNKKLYLDIKDLVEGYKIGKLTLVDRTGQRASDGSRIWKCKCECLRQPVCLVSELAIITGTVSSCGCVDNEEKANSILSTMYEKDDDKIHPESIGLYLNDDNNSQLNSNHLDDIDEDIVNHVLLFLERKGNPILLDRHERNTNARAACIEYYKKKYRWVSIRCFICDFSFGDIYGDDLEGKIHVHHKEQISSKSEIEYEINPHNDLVPVCPNCHMVLHSKRNGCYTPDEVKAMIRKAGILARHNHFGK